MSTPGNLCLPLVYDSKNVSDFVHDTYGDPCAGGLIFITLPLYSAILFLGTALNICICVVFARNYAMKSATNYYLLSLSVADLFSLTLGVPFEIQISIEGFYPSALPLVICKVRGFVSEWTSYVSVLTVAAFAFERWFAICRPLHFSTTSKHRRVVRSLVTIWILSGVFSVPIFYYVTINRIRLPKSFIGVANANNVSQDMHIPGTEVCALDVEDVSAQKFIVHTAFWLFFVLPLGVMSGLFVHIAYVVGHSGQPRYSIRTTVLGQTVVAKRSTAKRAVIKMLSAVGGTFFICWLPYHLQRVMSVHMLNPEAEWLHKLINVIFYISGYFYYTNTIVNPILYNVCNKKFRTAFTETIFHCRAVNRRKYIKTQHKTQISANSPAVVRGNRCRGNFSISNSEVSPFGENTADWETSVHMNGTTSPKIRSCQV